MRKPRQTSSAPNLHDMMAQRFPLVPRPKPVCRALDARVARVRELAHLADQRTGDSLVRAAEAQNLAALIMSDCGLPTLARELCWRQFHVFVSAGPFNAATAKLALQPILNLSRLLIRSGDGAVAYHLLDTLVEAATSRTDSVIDGTKINFGCLVSDDDYCEVIQWLWTTLLADGTRALTRAGRWSEALQHAQQHKGIGQRLLDGRQVAILAHCATRDYDIAGTMLADTHAPTPWEQAVAACLKVLCLTIADQPADSSIATMIDSYLRLETSARACRLPDPSRPLHPLTLPRAPRRHHRSPTQICQSLVRVIAQPVHPPAHNSLQYLAKRLQRHRDYTGRQQRRHREAGQSGVGAVYGGRADGIAWSWPSASALCVGSTFR